MGSGETSLLRKSLWPLSFLYRLVSGARNLAFDRGFKKSFEIDSVPIVSVGNLTVGGTGKTPMVVWLVARAREAGLRPGVLARGYGRAAGAELNDEGLLLRERFVDLPQVQDPDRVAGARRLCADHAVDLIILDDGYQHRRLRRNVDLVCLDAKSPFAQGALLPAGDLREAARPGLQRASLVVLTRLDRMEPGAGDAQLVQLADGRAGQIRDYAGRPELPVYACVHEPSRVVSLRDRTVEDEPSLLRGRRVLLVSAIARPDAFRATAEQLGCEVADVMVFRDHHVYGAEDAIRIARRAAELDASVLTTEKDAVKLRSLDFEAQVWVLLIDLRWVAASVKRGARAEPSASELGFA